jgi:hypothetical protein
MNVRFKREMLTGLIIQSYADDTAESEKGNISRKYDPLKYCGQMDHQKMTTAMSEMDIEAEFGGSSATDEQLNVIDSARTASVSNHFTMHQPASEQLQSGVFYTTGVRDEETF